MSPEEKLAIIRAVYETLFANTETFHGTCGATGLYLIGAIVQGGTIQVAKNASICVALRGVEGLPGLPPEHPVWGFIEEAAT